MISGNAESTIVSVAFILSGHSMANPSRAIIADFLSMDCRTESKTRNDTLSS